MIKRADTSPRLTYVIFIAIFLIMLAANMLSPAVSDDFTYMYSYAEGRERIESVGDIIESLRAHGEYMNGRYTVHFFAHLFLMLPPILFDLANSLVFTLQVFIIYKFGTRSSGRRNLLILLIFALLWLAQSKFGQVNLWLDGSCNYLWSVVMGLGFIAPSVNYLLSGKDIHPLLIIPYFLLAFMSGNSMENIAPAFILMEALLIFASKFIFGQKLKISHVIAEVFSVCGFVLMMSAPGEWLNKATDGEVSTLLRTFLTAMGILLSLAVPIALYVHLLIRAKRQRIDKRIILTSLIFVTGALASNFIMVLASYYALRSSIACTTLIIAAVSLLYPNVSHVGFGKSTKLVSYLFCAAVSLSLIIGFADIGYTYLKIKENERYIISMRDAGNTEIVIPDIKPYTKYSELYGLVYVDCEKAENWPNWVMTKYYGLKSIIGEPDER